MNIREMKVRDQKIEPSLQYKLSHQWLLAYLGFIGLLLAVFCVLMSIDERRFLPIGIMLLVVIGLTMIAYLIAMVVVRKKVMENPEKKEGAKHPARIPISIGKYKELRRQITHTTVEKGRLDAYRFFFADQLMNGDLQPALVVNADPCIVAVYSEQLDGVLLLTLPGKAARAAGLQQGDRLVAAVSYFEKPFARQGLQKDIFPGPGQTGKWMDLLPVLPVLLTEHRELLLQKENELPAELWEQAEEHIQRHWAEFPEFTRDAFWFTRLSSEDWDRNPIYEAKR